MAIRKIVCVPDPILRQKAKKIKDIDFPLRVLIEDMIETVKASNGAGLAAPQVGESIRLIVINTFEDSEPTALINPQVVRQEGSRKIQEGCLSVPGYYGEVTRSEIVKVKALDKDGKKINIKATGLTAQALEHEIDHLEGILYIDYIKDKGELHKIDPETQSQVSAKKA